MAVEVIKTEDAMSILGLSRTHVCKLIRKGVITTAFVGYPDGFTGKPGWRMYRDEIEKLAEERKNKKEARLTAKKHKSRPKNHNRESIIQTLDELQICLAKLSETIGKLKEEL